MDLVDRYLQAVKLWLPARQREDIAAELREDIRSEIEEKESGLGRPLETAELEALLKRRGRPIVAAGRFRPQRSLIGPALFPIYATVLRVLAIPYVVLWTVRWVYVFVTSPAVRAESPVTWVAHAGSAFWTTALLLFGGITLLFAVLEQVQSRTRFLGNWDPRHLSPVRDAWRIQRSSSITELALQVAFALWWVRPQAFVSVEYHGRGFWAPGATWEHLHRGLFLPVLLLSLVMAGLALVNFIRPHWTPLRAGVRAATHWASALIAAVVLAECWQGFRAECLLLRQTSGSGAGAGWVTAVTDVVVYVTLASIGIGASIAFAVAVVRVIRLRRRDRPELSPAPHTTEAFCL
jgi:hypothetical protein